MDLDLPADIFNEGPAFTGNLLSQLPDRSLTNDEPAAQTSNSIPNTIAVDLNQAGAVVSKIEDIFEKIALCILDEKKELVIKLKTRGRQAARTRDAETGTIKSLPNDETRSVRFPSRSPKEAWKFTALFRILELSHGALVAGIVVTKRSIFYQDPELFIKQAVVDRCVDDLAYTLGVERDALNVVAAAKGLVAGSFKLTRNDGSVVDFTVEPEGMLVPNTKDIQNLQLLHVQWVLVIEKEATFRTIARSKYWSSSLAGKGIIITAKGYPDIQTRQFLRFLSVHALHIPTLALVDFDPDGLGIMSTYKYGSVALAHENHNLAMPMLRWVGIRSSDIVQDGADKQGLLKLSVRDRRIAMRMLEKDVFEEGGGAAEWRRELQLMLMLHVKAEIQILGPGEGLETWLDGKLVDAITA